MANFQNLLDSIASVIHQNGNQEITGEVLKSTLQSMVSVLGANATFGGIAHISDNPGTPDGPVVYIASDVGTYPNFGALTIDTDELAVFVWNPTAGTWTKESITYIADKSEIEELIQQGIEDINDAKTEALNEIGQIVQNIDVTYETIEGDNVQLKNGQGNLLMPKTTGKIIDDVPDINDFPEGLAITDPKKNVILNINNGHIRTKNFNSENFDMSSSEDYAYDFAIVDGKGYAIAKFKDGEIVTKNFNSKYAKKFQYASKVVNCLGDSITYGRTTSGNRANPTWVEGVAQNLGCICNNYGVNATSICTGSSESFVTRLLNMAETKCDVLTIMGGTNDYGDNRATTLGSITDAAEEGTNFYAAFKYLVENAILKYPSAKIVVITPLRRQTNGANSFGISMEDIVRAEIDVANYYCLPSLDMYHNGSLNPEIEIMRTTYTTDGLHPNQAGINRWLIPTFSQFIETILNYS